MDYEQLKSRIDSRLAADPAFRAVSKRIGTGRATFADTAEYSRILARIIGNELSANVLELSDREQITQQLLQYGYKDINEVCARVQSSLDKTIGVSIRPQTADFPAERVQQFSHSLVDPTVEDSVIQRRAKNGTANITMSFHDDYIEKNAKFRNDAGLNCYIERIGSSCCDWCTEVAGKYLFGTQPKDIFRRHDKCDCVIIYDNKVLRGKLNAKGESTKTWEEIPDTERADYTPERISQRQAEKLQNQKLSQIRGIRVDNSGRSGIIESENSYTTAGLMFISHRDDLYRFAEKVTPLKEHEDIVLHADRESFLILEPESQDIVSRLSPKEVADLIRNSSNYKDSAIRLLSCQSGYGGNSSLAQKLANELGVEVIAPTEILAISNTGDMFISDNQLLIDMWEAGEHVKETGKWETFKPEKEGR